MSKCDSTDALDITELRIFESELDRQEGVDVLGLTRRAPERIVSGGQVEEDKGGKCTRLSITLQRSMYLSAPSADGSS